MIQLKRWGAMMSLGAVLLVTMGCGGGETPTGAGGAGGSGGQGGETSSSVDGSTGTGVAPDVVLGHGCEPGTNGKDRRTPVAPFWNDAFGPGGGKLNEVGALAALRTPADTAGKHAATAYTYYVSEPIPGPGAAKYCGRVDHEVLFYVVKKSGVPEPHPTAVRTVAVKQADLAWAPDPVYVGSTAEVTISIDPPLEFGDDEAVLAGIKYAVTDTENRLCPIACHDGPDPNSFFSDYDMVTFKVAACPSENCDLKPMEVSPDSATAHANGSFDDRWVGFLTIHQIE